MLTPVLLTIHTILVLALVGVVLLQRSEGGALGMGGGGGGGLMSGRGAANVLTRTTTILGAAFFVTSLLLAMTSDTGVSEADIRRDLTGEDQTQINETDGGDIDATDLPGFEITPPVAADDATPVLPDLPTDLQPIPDNIPEVEGASDIDESGADDAEGENPQ